MSKVLSPSKKAKEYLEKERVASDKPEERLAALVDELSLCQSNEDDFSLVSEVVEEIDLTAPRKSNNSDIKNFLIGRQNLEYLEELTEERKANIENYPR